MLHVLKEVHLRVMAVSQLDQVLKLSMLWKRLNQAGKQWCVVLLNALQMANDHGKCSQEMQQNTIYNRAVQCQSCRGPHCIGGGLQAPCWGLHGLLRKSTVCSPSAITHHCFCESYPHCHHYMGDFPSLRTHSYTTATQTVSLLPSPHPLPRYHHCQLDSPELEQKLIKSTWLPKLPVF